MAGTLLLASFACHAKTKPVAVPLSTFHDADGLSFQYPKVWSRSNSASSYFGFTILKNEVAPEVAVTFSPKGNVYEKTNLIALMFVYAKIPAGNEGRCIEQAKSQDTEVDEDLVTLHDVTFHHIRSGGAGMCHDVDRDVYWTYRDGSCHMFEAHLETRCPGVVEGKRALTVKEIKALNRHLLAIPQTIRFVNAK